MELKKCIRCGEANKTVDHLASRCEKMLRATTYVGTMKFSNAFALSFVINTI